MTNPASPAPATPPEALRLAHEAKTWISQVVIAAHRKSPAQTKVAVEALEAFIDKLAAAAAAARPDPEGVLRHVDAYASARVEAYWQINEGHEDCAINEAIEARDAARAELLAALAAAPSPAPGTVGWQPISTAPKDGTHVLAMIPDSDTCHVICWVDASKGIRPGCGVYGWHIAWDGYPLAGYSTPTSWMHLPPTAVVAEEGL